MKYDKKLIHSLNSKPWNGSKLQFKACACASSSIARYRNPVSSKKFKTHKTERLPLIVELSFSLQAKYAAAYQKLSTKNALGSIKHTCRNGNVLQLGSRTSNLSDMAMAPQFERRVKETNRRGDDKARQHCRRHWICRRSIAPHSTVFLVGHDTDVNRIMLNPIDRFLAKYRLWSPTHRMVSEFDYWRTQSRKLRATSYSCVGVRR